LYQLGFYDQAIEYARKALQLNGEDSVTWNNLGYLLLRQYSGDKPEFNTPLKIFPLTFNSISGALYLEEAQYYEESLKCFNKALQLKQTDDELTFLYWANRCYPLYYLGRYQEALSSSKAAIKIKKDSDIVWVNKGLIQMKLERYSDAIESFKKALKINPDYQEVKYKIACCYALKGNVKQTLSTLKEAIAIDGKYLEVAKNDPCLCSIRKDRRFNHFLSNLH